VTRVRAPCLGVGEILLQRRHAPFLGALVSPIHAAGRVATATFGRRALTSGGRRIAGLARGGCATVASEPAPGDACPAKRRWSCCSGVAAVGGLLHLGVADGGAQTRACRYRATEAGCSSTCSDANHHAGCSSTRSDTNRGRRCAPRHGGRRADGGVVLSDSEQSTTTRSSPGDWPGRHSCLPSSPRRTRCRGVVPRTRRWAKRRIRCRLRGHCPCQVTSWPLQTAGSTGRGTRAGGLLSLARHVEGCGR